MSDRNSPNRNRQDTSRRGPLIALAAIVVIFVVGWILVRALSANSKLEDCLLSGRTNCAPIQGTSR